MYNMNLFSSKQNCRAVGSVIKFSLPLELFCKYVFATRRTLDNSKLYLCSPLCPSYNNMFLYCCDNYLTCENTMLKYFRRITNCSE